MGLVPSHYHRNLRDHQNQPPHLFPKWTWKERSKSLERRPIHKEAAWCCSKRRAPAMIGGEWMARQMSRRSSRVKRRTTLAVGLNIDGPWMGKRPCSCRTPLAWTERKGVIGSWGWKGSRIVLINLVFAAGFQKCRIVRTMFGGWQKDSSGKTNHMGCIGCSPVLAMSKLNWL